MCGEHPPVPACRPRTIPRTRNNARSKAALEPGRSSRTQTRWRRSTNMPDVTQKALYAALSQAWCPDNYEMRGLNRHISWADQDNLQHAELGLQAERESHWGIDTREWRRRNRTIRGCRFSPAKGWAPVSFQRPSRGDGARALALRFSCTARSKLTSARRLRIKMPHLTSVWAASIGGFLIF